MVMPADDPENIGLSGIGTGPFKAVDLDPRRRIVMEANENYWREGYPYLERLEVVNRGGQMEGAVNGFLGGQFDAVTNIDPGLVGQLEGRDDAHLVYASGGDQALMILPKYEGSIFEDKRIRQALAYAIDREAIARIVYRGEGGWIGNDSHMASSDVNFLPHPHVNDVERARALLAEAGYPDVELGWVQFRGIVGPKGMPEDHKQKLHEAFMKALESERVQKWMEANALDPMGYGPEEFTKFVKRYDELAATWVERLGVGK
jgi:ABC-type transport system substrate-binding protein